MLARRLLLALTAAAAVLTAVAVVLWQDPGAVATDPSVPATPGGGDDLGTREVIASASGSPLGYRAYGAEAGVETVLVLLHGPGLDSRYLAPAAAQLAGDGVAVYTPDLRGHGPDPVARGDVDYVGQMEDDVLDLLDHIGSLHADAALVIGGHSAGAGLALRFAGSEHGARAAAHVLLAPDLGRGAPTTADGPGGWGHVNTGRILVLDVLNAVGVTLLNDREVVRLAVPGGAADGGETRAYTYRLERSYWPRTPEEDLTAVASPLLVVGGVADAVSDAARYRTFAAAGGDVDIELVAGAGHWDLVDAPAARQAIHRWIDEVAAGSHGEIVSDYD